MSENAIKEHPKSAEKTQPDFECTGKSSPLDEFRGQTPQTSDRTSTASASQHIPGMKLEGTNTGTDNKGPGGCYAPDAPMKSQYQNTAKDMQIIKDGKPIIKEQGSTTANIDQRIIKVTQPIIKDQAAQQNSERRYLPPESDPSIIVCKPQKPEPIKQSSTEQVKDLQINDIFSSLPPEGGCKPQKPEPIKQNPNEQIKNTQIKDIYTTERGNFNPKDPSLLSPVEKMSAQELSELTKDIADRLARGDKLGSAQGEINKSMQRAAESGQLEEMVQRINEELRKQGSDKSLSLNKEHRQSLALPCDSPYDSWTQHTVSMKDKTGKEVDSTNFSANRKHHPGLRYH